MARLPDGAGATGQLAAGPGGFYGVTPWGGAAGRGTVFVFNPSTGEVRTVHAFVSAHERTSPRYGLTYADGWPYGTTRGGPGLLGPGGGAIYRLHPGSSVLQGVHAFTPQRVSPEGRLCLHSDASLYGIAPPLPGQASEGVAYRYTPATDTYEALFEFPASDTIQVPSAPVVTPDGAIWGTTQGSSIAPHLPSTVFRLVPGPGGYTYEGAGTVDIGDRAPLTLGFDGLLHGYPQESVGFGEGLGTLFTLDPAAGGPASNPFSLSRSNLVPNVPSRPTVIRAMYASPNGVNWVAGSNALAAPLP